MSVVRIDDNHLAEVEALWERSRRLYQNIGREDLPALLKNQIAVLGKEAGRAWGFLCIQSEARPPTLPATAPNRAYIRAIALAQGHSSISAISRLLQVATSYLPTYASHHLLTVYGDQGWLNDALIEAGFTVEEEVQFLALPRLQRWQPPTTATKLGAQRETLRLRLVHPDDLPALAALDGETFTPLWHFGVDGLWELLMAGQVKVATFQNTLVGYAAISYHEGSAHLARLAVHPRWQGQGFGHALLLDALLEAQRAGINTVMLNTQVHNRRAQRLYRDYGFRPTGQIVPVLGLAIGPTSAAGMGV
ncbi:MAG: GNAT family N-acetyltransferase [Caldilineaceae bacterium]